jgi:hypothetical protein
MEPTGFRAKGSFGVPSEMIKDMEARRRQQEAAPPPAHPKAPPPPVVAEAETPEPEAPEAKKAGEPSKEEQYVTLRKNLEERLDTTITPEDIKEYIFKGVLSKEVTIVPGLLKGTFRTLTPTEIMEIDKREASFRDEGKYTIDGVSNQRALVTLSYSWVAAAGKPLSGQNEPAVREKHIRRLGVHIVDAAVSANTDFNALVRLVLQERAFVKK